ncbi:MAG: substrate-binding domain-containing protein [Treponema sp.]|nr:substrate-binding domain-containing protein [Treponema sp.]
MRIGLVLNILDEEYQISVYSGVKKRAQELGVELICFQQENLKFAEKSLLASFPSKEFFNLDGIIFLTSVISDKYDIKCKSQLEKLWGKIPVVSVGQKVQDIPSLLIQTDASMKQLIEHLILNHNYKKFFYIGGSLKHQDAIKREEIFIKTIEAYKPWYPELSYTIKRGWFTEKAAIKAMETYYAEGHGAPDVIVCANDNMAIGVYKFLKINSDNPEIGFPAVTGFDDVPQGQFVIPALTTVHQPMVETGEASVDAILDLIDKKELPSEQFIESNLVLRNSCGCGPEKALHFDEEVLEKMQSRFVQSEMLLRTVSYIGQDLNYCQTLWGLQYIINENIAQLGIKNFCVLAFSIKNQAIDASKIKVKDVYVRRNGVHFENFTNGEELSLSDFYSKYLYYDDEIPNSMIFKALHIAGEIIGCVLYDGPSDILPYLCSVCISIGQSIMRILDIEERKKRSEYLEKEVEKRTRELLEANSKRMEVEAEVLRISEIERQRFSNDLHDDICQRLAGISMLCKSYSNQSDPVDKKQMLELAELISDTLVTTRQYAHNSYPVELESLGMNKSIHNLCVSFEKQTGIKVLYEWAVPESVVFDKTQKLNIFRIIQEALHNVMKHSRAASVLVQIKKTGSKLYVKVVDDGCGIKAKRSELGEKKGLGINSMQYRANQIGASFTVKANKPSGTCVQVVLKL